MKPAWLAHSSRHKINKTSKEELAREERVIHKAKSKLK
jgi:hypothetical protein